MTTSLLSLDHDDNEFEYDGKFNLDHDEAEWPKSEASQSQAPQWKASMSSTRTTKRTTDCGRVRVDIKMVCPVEATMHSEEHRRELSMRPPMLKKKNTKKGMWDSLTDTLDKGLEELSGEVEGVTMMNEAKLAMGSKELLDQAKRGFWTDPRLRLGPLL